MATGFVDRYKGKLAVPVGGTWVGGVQVNTTGADSNTGVGWGTVDGTVSTGSPQSVTGSTIRSGGITNILSTALAIYNLSAPVPGMFKIINISSASTGWMLKVSTGVVTVQGTQGAGNGGSSLSNTIKSTVTLVATQIELVGLSTTQWMFMSVYPSTLSHLTFSTST